MSPVGGPERGGGGGKSPRRRRGGPAEGPGSWTESRCRSGPARPAGIRVTHLGLWRKCFLLPSSSLRIENGKVEEEKKCWWWQSTI